METVFVFETSLEEAMKTWGSRNLLQAYWMLGTPDWNDDGEAVINENDIVDLRRYILAADKEIKALKATEAAQ